MRRFINDPSNVVEEMLEGYVEVHGRAVRRADGRVIARADPGPAQVRVIAGGGSGHEPALLGYVGRGVLDAVVVGDVFASPPAARVRDAIEEVDSGEGVLIVIGNYPGDVLNFEMGAGWARERRHDVEIQVVTDDVGAGVPEDPRTRRGLAGGILVWKVAGAAAAAGAPLAEVRRIAAEANRRARTVAVGFAGPTTPGSDRPTFSMQVGELAFGTGHGDPGVRTDPFGGVDGAIDVMTDWLLNVGERLSPDEPVVTISNGLGSTSLMELYVAHRRLAQRLREEGFGVHRAYVGNLYTALDMAGLSVTILPVDDELADLIDAPAACPHFAQGEPA